MDEALFQEGIAYAERNLLGAKGHSYLDRRLIEEKFDLAGKEVLDFGCGMGFNSIWLANHMGARVDAVDLDENHIEIARELMRRHGRKPVQFSTRNIITHPINKKYDCIMLNDVIEHIVPDCIAAILDALITRNLKEGGVIFFSYPPWEG
ncbi:MAG TPA: methyltransferase domain-containing protein, partial [Chitinophagaceae bacterium]|nr:methyltransferase domain-containing protein [Chitinophagaceae bacterium]